MNPAPAPSPLRYAWWIVALLFPVALLNYLDRQMLATMKSSMVGDIPSIANKADWGLVLGGFKWTYAILSPFAGYVSDRLGRRHVIGTSLLVWSIITWWTGHVTTYHELLTARALMGMSEAFYIPAALALIADYHPGATRSKAVGVHQTGIYLGQICGGFAGYVADSPDHGWRWAFSTCGMVGVIYALPLFALLRNPPQAAATAEAPGESRGVLRGLLGNRNFLLLVLYFTLPAIAGWVVRDWMPDILKEKFHLGQGKAGVSAILFVQIASLVGALIGGADPGHLEQLTVYGAALGLAFQIIDDVLDVTADLATLGKDPGSDKEAGKTTFVDLLGIDGARARAAQVMAGGIEALARVGDAAQPLVALARYTIDRDR